MAKKVSGWIVIIFLVLFIAYRPASAAAMVHQLGSVLVNVGRGFGDFFSRLVR